MSVRDAYIGLLSKYAAANEDMEFDHGIDSQAVALKEHEANRGDTRSTLMGMFGQAGNVENGNSKTMRKYFDERDETSNPLLKLAFAQVMTEAGVDPHVSGVAALGFQDELEKIALFTEELHTALDAARRKPKTVGGTAQKFLEQYKKRALTKRASL